MDGPVVNFTGMVTSIELKFKLNDFCRINLTAPQRLFKTHCDGYTPWHIVLNFFFPSTLASSPWDAPSSQAMQFCQEVSHLRRPTTRRRLSAEATLLVAYIQVVGIQLIYKNRRVTTHTPTPVEPAFSTHVPCRHRTKHINWKEASACAKCDASWKANT